MPKIIDWLLKRLPDKNQDETVFDDPFEQVIFDSLSTILTNYAHLRKFLSGNEKIDKTLLERIQNKIPNAIIEALYVEAKKLIVQNIYTRFAQDYRCELTGNFSPFLIQSLGGSYVSPEGLSDYLARYLKENQDIPKDFFYTQEIFRLSGCRFRSQKQRTAQAEFKIEFQKICKDIFKENFISLDIEELPGYNIWKDLKEKRYKFDLMIIDREIKKMGAQQMDQLFILLDLPGSSFSIGDALFHKGNILNTDYRTSV